MDKARLVERNRQLTAFQHRLTWREELRRRLLQAYAWLPRPMREKPNRGTFLLIRPDHLGDLLLLTPAVRALKKAQPNCRLIALAGAWSADVLAAYPEIDLVLTIPFPGFTRQRKESLSSPYTLAWNWALKVRALKAETAIVFRPDHWWGALLAYMAGIPRRVGYDHPDVRPFLTHRLPLIERHAAMQNARLVEQWTGAIGPDKLDYHFPISDGDRDHVSDLLAAAQIPAESRLIAIHGGAGTPIKQWLPENWATVADRLASRLDAKVIFTGSDREHNTIFPIMDRMKNRAVSVAGDTNIAQLAALYERATVVLGADSGPLHLAVASGAPTVHLFGPADPEEFGPLGDPHRQVVITSDIGCRPCRILDWPGDSPANHPCIRDIKPQQVIEAAIQAVQLR
ncbi:MAG TPA: glycosyltransferase family 9 protein [Aggregatilineales bacterium]|nr:glycosyltransferase family 9 protein [Aggregatilineales bacterium]